MIIIEKLMSIIAAYAAIVINFISSGEIFAKINQLMQPITQFQGFWLFRWYLNNLLFFLMIAGLIGLVGLLIENYQESKSKESKSN